MKTTEERLTDLGWREYPCQFKKDARMWCKRFETATRCLCNDDKSGMQIELYVWPPYCDEDSETYEVEICGETKMGWVRLSHYGISDLNDALRLPPALLDIWERAANPTTTP